MGHLATNNGGTTGTTGATTQTVCPTYTTTSTTASSDTRRNNTSLMNICSTDDAVRNLNDNILGLPDATLIYPKDPVSIKYLKRFNSLRKAGKI